MVGIVIVSHSRKLAEEIINFSIEMAQSDIKIINAGGMSDGSFGTDANLIMQSMMKADDGDGVVILVDLGSAIMSTNIAMEFLEDDLAKRVVIADAPIVEGSIGAVTQASIGSR